MSLEPESKVSLEAGWNTQLRSEFEQPYMQELRQFLAQRRREGATVFPPREQMFQAFNSTPFDQVKVVVLGQDPYHGLQQAHGLSFSVLPGVPVPPSLRNIYAELETDLSLTPPQHGYLQSWADQGVLLLNSVLTVEQGAPQSHQGKGWERFTDAAIRALTTHREGLVFMLWGRPAQKKGQFIDRTKHHVLRSPHPSPLSAYRGFLGCKHFSQANAHLVAQGMEPVDWALPALEDDVAPH